MDVSSHTEVTFDELNCVLGSISDAYGWVSRKYYLPSITSKAITRNYLMRMIFAKSDVLKVPNTIQKNFIEYKGMTVGEMLEKLDAFLK